jgi:hypothetical protein
MQRASDVASDFGLNDDFRVCCGAKRWLNLFAGIRNVLAPQADGNYRAPLFCNTAGESAHLLACQVAAVACQNASL